MNALAALWPASRWHRIRWRNASHARPWAARFAAARVTPAHGWRRYLMPEVRALVRLAHQRWAIGLDHFEGRSWPGWQRHVALTALAYSLL